MARYQIYRMGDGRIRWRVLAGNNRVVGKGADDYADVESALDDVVVTRSLAQDAEAVAARVTLARAGSGRWRWQLPADTEDRCLVHSAQEFARRIDAQLAATRFVTAAADAPVEPRLAVFEPGRRGRTVA